MGSRAVANPTGAEAAEGDVQGPSGSPTAPARVLVVDDDPTVRDVIAALLREEGYDTGAVSGAEEALEACRVRDVHLVLSDVKMPGKDGLWLLERLRGDHPDVAVVMLTGHGDTEIAVECLRRGASDYLLKPPRLAELVRALERALARRRLELARHRYRSSLESRVREKTAELQKALRDLKGSYHSTLDALVNALDAREHETGDHSQRVVRFTLGMAERLKLPEKLLPDIGYGALLHDLGKIGVADAILLKEGPLTDEEWKEMRRHPQIGWRMIRHIPFLRGAAEIVLSHQERWDGSGYPRQLRGEDIPVGARIFAVADTLDAMTNDRPYRRGGSFDACRREVARCSGSQFDPRCVEAFLSMDDAAILALAKRRRS
jgi:response regulator RpfG family c-di-GMP phosphodiesterase